MSSHSGLNFDQVLVWYLCSIVIASLPQSNIDDCSLESNEMLVWNLHPAISKDLFISSKFVILYFC